MRKWVKRTFLSFAVLLAIAAGLSFWLVHAEPAWYRAKILAPAERDALAERAEQSMIGVTNWADEFRAAAVRRSSGEEPATQPASLPKGTHAVAFSENELNALFQKWSQFNGWDDRLAKYVSDPVIAVRAGNLVLAGKLKEVNTIASFHFSPKIDEKGLLRLTLKRVMAGRLPLPNAIWTSQRDRMTSAILVRMPMWQASARIAPDGSANQDAILAAMGKTLLELLNDRPAEADIFINSMPVRVTELTVTEEQIGATVVPLTDDERQALLRHIKEPTNAPTTQASAG
jgi:hypothetical protein